MWGSPRLHLFCSLMLEEREVYYPSSFTLNILHLFSNGKTYVTWHLLSSKQIWVYLCQYVLREHLFCAWHCARLQRTRLEDCRPCHVGLLWLPHYTQPSTRLSDLFLNDCSFFQDISSVHFFSFPAYTTVQALHCCCSVSLQWQPRDFLCPWFLLQARISISKHRLWTHTKFWSPYSSPENKLVISYVHGIMPRLLYMAHNEFSSFIFEDYLPASPQTLGIFLPLCMCVQAVLYLPTQGDHQMTYEASSCFKAPFKRSLLEAFLSVPLSQSICFLLRIPVAHMCLCLIAFIPFCLALELFACLFPILSYKLCERGENWSWFCTPSIPIIVFDL